MTERYAGVSRMWADKDDWCCTSRLRFVHRDCYGGISLRLQQQWVKLSGEAEWRDVPIVEVKGQ